MSVKEKLKLENWQEWHDALEHLSGVDVYMV